MTQRVISFHYTLTGANGQTLDSSAGQDPMSFMEGAGQIIPGLEKELLGLKVNEKKTMMIAAADAYGEYDQRFVVEIPLEDLPNDKVKVGDQFQAGEDPDSHPFVVTEVTKTHAMLDANHPLAGMDLTFAVELISIRPATEEELAHGHAHGSDGTTKH